MPRVVPKPPPQKTAGQIIDPKKDGTVKEIRLPVKDRLGQPISAQPQQNTAGRIIAPTTNNVTIINNNTYITNITNVQNNWNGRRDYGYQWHYWEGRDICHHYDPYGYHWWGFYVGPVYFWTRYWDDQYWWYDPYWGRWVYLHDGRWWYRDPYSPRVVYVYTDGGYYRYEDSHGGVVMNPDPTPPVVMPPDPDPTPVQPQEKVYTSADGTRIVRVSGDGKKTAYLYDTADPPAFQPVWLGDGVNEIRFKNDQGRLVQILAITDDGSFGIYDQNGYALNARPAPQPKVYTSPDGSRSVSVSNDANATAVLSDTANPPSFEPITLANGVTNVKFKMDDQGALSEIALILSDGNFAVYDKNGQPISATAPVPPAPAPDAPPPPATAPSLMKSAAFQSLKGTLLGW